MALVRGNGVSPGARAFSLTTFFETLLADHLNYFIFSHFFSPCFLFWPTAPSVVSPCSSVALAEFLDFFFSPLVFCT